MSIIVTYRASRACSDSIGILATWVVAISNILDVVVLVCAD